MTDVRYVSTVNGNIPYWEHSHTVLVTISLATAAITLPYTLTVIEVCV